MLGVSCEALGNLRLSEARLSPWCSEQWEDRLPPSHCRDMVLSPLFPEASVCPHLPILGSALLSDSALGLASLRPYSEPLPPSPPFLSTWVLGSPGEAAAFGIGDPRAT